MKNRKRRYGKPLAVFLSLCLAVTSVVLPAWAEEDDAGGEAEGTQSASGTAGAAAEENGQDGEYIEDEYIVWYDNFFEDESDRRTLSSLPSEETGVAALLEEDEVAAVQEGEADAEGSDPGIALIRLDSDLTEEEETDFIDELASRPGIAGVEKNQTVRTYAAAAQDVSAYGVSNDAYSDQQYALSSVRADEAWDMIDYDTAAQVRVAVVDSGVDAKHPDLEGKILDGYNFVDYDSIGRKYSENDASDDNGHGTHVAGIIAAVSGNSMGISGVTGTLDVQILPVKVLNDEGKGSIYEVAQGIRYAADNGADIINLSLGSSYPSDLEEEAVEYAQSKGVLVVAASGNDATDVAYSYPAGYDGVLAVGSIDQQDERSYFSNYGERLDLSAPGTAILSTVPESTTDSLRAEGYQIYGNALDGYYAVFSGTSMASPYAAGVAAVYKAVNPSADSSDIREHLKNTARDVGDIGFDIYTGSGCVDAAAALGEEIKQIAVRMKSPQSGSEIYEKTSVRFQVNTAMDIDHVSLYMDEISEESRIADIPVNSQESIYEYILDTTEFADGTYTLIAKAFDKSGSAVGDEASVGSLNIANTITDGFVIEVEDPQNNPANLADVEIYGLSSRTGKYAMIYSGTTTDLGYLRVRNLDPYHSYSDYEMLVYGSWDADGDTSYYSYRMTDLVTGKKIIADAETAKAEPVSFSMKGTDGREVENPYLILNPVTGGTDGSDGSELGDSPVFTMYSDSSLYLSEGDYHFKTYWSPSATQNPDYSKPGYYLSGETSVSGSDGSITADYKEAGILEGSFDEGFDGILEVSAASSSNSIPFLPGGYIRGRTLYLTPGDYEIKGIVSKEVDGKNWSVTLEKEEICTVKAGEKQTVHFSAQVELTKFEPAENSVQKDDNGGYYIYRGDVLRTINEMSMDGDTVLSGFSGDYPTFSVYRILDDDTEQLVYTITDTWQARNSYWNSGRISQVTGILPEAGSYRAELTFDAGPLGGESRLTFDFELRNRSGGEETDSMLRLGDSASLPYAEMTLYRWDDEQQAWVNAMKDESTVRYDVNSTASIEDSQLEFNEEGINVAVIQYGYIKSNDVAAIQQYNGFQTYVYESLEDLKNITLSDTLSDVYVRVYDRYGNNLTSSNIRVNVRFSLKSSAGGKLVKEEALPDIVLPDARIYIPDGSYDYVCAAFNAYGEEYFLIDRDVSTGSGEITLDGKKTSKLKIDIPDSCYSSMIWPVLADGRNLSGAGLNFGDQSEFYWSAESYTPVMTLQTADRQGQITVQTPEIDLSSDQKITVSGDFKVEISLHQTQISEGQNVTGEIQILDSQGNRMISSASGKGGFYYEEETPVLITGKAGSQGTECGTVSYTQLRLTPDDYDGAGEYFIRFSCPFGEETLTGEVSYFVTDGSTQSGVTIQEDPLFETGTDGGTAYAVAARGSDGYRTLTARIPSSEQEQNVEFCQIRDGSVIASTGISDIFNESQNEYTAGFQVKAGDRIEVHVSLTAEQTTE